MVESNLFTLREFIDFVAKHSLEEVYGFLECDYEHLKEIELSGSSSEIQIPFLNKFVWRKKPTFDEACRIFNQVNSFYAEKLVAECSPDLDLVALVRESHSVLLYRQGKGTGFRHNNIGFGIRADLPYNHPFRRGGKWLLGSAPEFIEDDVNLWKRAFWESAATLDSAIILMMAFIAIHPFRDGNGRVARLMFAFFNARRRNVKLYMNEATDGELFRPGYGLQSTEYLMGSFLRAVTSGHNILEPGAKKFRTDASASRMSRSLGQQMRGLSIGDSSLSESEEFKELKRHFISLNHFVESSPRFKCLESVMC